MDAAHFMEWISYFIHKFGKEENLAQDRRHLLVLDGHKSHITLEVLMIAKEHGIDMINLPTHTSHLLQPLDKTYFRLSKVAFRAYRNFWNLKNHGSRCRKADLAQWASLALKKALTSENFKSDFRAIGI